MPRDQFDIKMFDKGLITFAEQQDIPPESASYSENIDGDAVMGRLQGIPGFTSKSTDAVKSMGLNSWVTRADDKYDLIYTDGTDIRAVQDFYVSPTDSSAVISNIVAKSMVNDAFAVHIGTGSTASNKPKWVGRPNWNMFGGIGYIQDSGIVVGGNTGSDKIGIFGSYTGTADALFYIKITASGSSVSFDWKKDGGSYTGTPKTYTTIPVELTEGLWIYFSGLYSGFHVNDIWTINVATAITSLVGLDAEVKCVESPYTTPSDNTFSLAVTANGMGTTNGRIDANYYRAYKFSVIYDGVQESLLSAPIFWGTSTDLYDSITVFVVANKGSSIANGFNRRITGVNVYCAVSGVITVQTENYLGTYKLVGTVDVTNQTDVTKYNPTSVNPVLPIFQSSTVGVLNGAGTDKLAKLYDTNALGATYEANSGIPEDADYNIINYELSAECAGFLFAGKGYQEKFVKAKFMIFRSKEARYDMFDIVNDIMTLSIIPTAMCGFNGKLYVWDANTTIVINPEGLYIENIIRGKGCSSQTSFYVIDIVGTHALVFSDHNNVYITDGQGVKDLGTVIKKASASSNSIGWQSYTDNAIITFDAIKNIILFILGKDAFTYHIVNKRWDFCPNFANGITILGTTSGKHGESYCSNGTALLQNFADTINRAWDWYSNEIDLETPSQIKAWYELILDHAGSHGVAFSIDKGVSWIANTEIKDIGGGWERAKSIKIHLSGTAGIDYISALSILYRRMIGVR